MTGEPSAIFVFGSFNGAGHHVWSGRRIATDDEVPYITVQRACDAIGTPDYRGRPDEPEGAIVRRDNRKGSLPIPAGWSFVSWWDRQGDIRNGSHTGILAAGVWSDAQLISAGRRLAPWAFRVAVAAP